jgi:putative oxidoreductase
MMKTLTTRYWQVLPDFDWSHILLRLPLAVMFIQQGMSKLPFNPAVGSAMGLSELTWFVVIAGQLGAGVGLLAGGILSLYRIRDLPFAAEIGDLITRLSGITMACIMTGIIWVVLKPQSLWLFVTTDYMHFSLWVGGVYFALRGNWAVASKMKQN